MGVTSLTSREFNQDAARATKAALTGPVFIIDFDDRLWDISVVCPYYGERPVAPKSATGRPRKSSAATFLYANAAMLMILPRSLEGAT